MREIDVGIVGAGTAGSAAALFLARAGHTVTLYECVPDPRPVGAGIVLQPTGQSVMARLGLLGAVRDRGARIDRLHCVTESGRSIIDLEYAMVDSRLFGLGLHRGVLFEALFEAARAQERVTIALGVEVASFVREAGRATLVDKKGARHGPHDLVVVADGAGSDIVDPAVRRRVAPYAWGALWAVLPDPSPVYEGKLYQVVRRAERMLGLLPTGRGPGEGGPNVTSLYWSIRGDRLAEWKSTGLAAWKEEILRFDPRAEALLASIEEPEQVLYASYKDVVMRHWHGDGIAWLGDAAHAMSPQLGQGANLALWDAMTFADAMGAHGTVREALAAYTRARRSHLDFYQLATRSLTPFFQSDSRVLGVLRDLLMPIGGAIPWMRRRMVRSMSGLERGIVRAALPLEAVAAALR